MEWKFRPASVGEKHRNPALPYLFEDSNGEAAQWLIREVVQNAMDAGTAETVRLKFKIAKIPDFTNAWMDEIEEHLLAERNGLPTETVREEIRAADTKALIIEDFNTTGLLGPITPEPPPDDAQKSRYGYYYFAHAEGESGKDASDRGSWGLGKQVLPKASKLNTFFAWTIRRKDEQNQPSQLLFGQCILKYHTAGGRTYAPDGFFGELADPDGEPWLLRPILKPDEIEIFSRSMEFERTDEPGLSVFIPSLKEGYDSNALIRELVHNYYYSFASDALRVSVIDDAGSGDPVLLNSDTIEQLAGNMFPNDAEFSALRSIIHARMRGTNLHAMTDVCFRYKDKEKTLSDLVDRETRTETLSALDQGTVVRLRVCFELKNRRIDGLVNGHVDVYLARNPELGVAHPAYFRDGIQLTKIKARNRPRGIFMAAFLESGDDNQLSALLRLCEDPKHTKWNVESDRAKKEFLRSANVARRVQALPTQIAQFLSAARTGVNRQTLATVFPIPRDLNTTGAASTSKRGHQGSTKGDTRRSEEVDMERPKSKPKAYSLHGLSGGGFSVSGLEVAGTRFPMELRIKIAYDTVTGDAFKSYQEYDFDLSDEGFEIVCEGDVKLQERNGNILRLQLISDDFQVSVRGFDQHRDLIIKPRAVTIEVSS